MVEDFEGPGDKDTPTDPRSAHVVAVSAHTAASHRANQSTLAEWLRENPTVRLEDVAYTTTARRVHQPSFRFACAVSSIKDLIHALESDVNSNMDGPQPITTKSPIIFVFTGQGSHYAGMGAELYRTSPVFRDTVDLCKQICDGFGFPQFLDIITETKTGTDTDRANNAASSPAWNTAQTQLATVTLEIGLATFWKRMGVEPALVIGHSLGEYAAMHVAGVLSLADTLYLVGSRAALAMQKCQRGTYAMLAVSAPAADLQDLLKTLGLNEERAGQSCSVACINSPSASVLSGTMMAVARVQAALKQRNIRTKLLPLPFGFHSSQVDSIMDDFTAVASGPGITYSPPRVPVASTLLGSIIDAKTPAGQGFGAEYLTKQARNSVDFVGGLHAIQSWASRSNASGTQSGSPVWLEIGPGQVCGSFVQETISPPDGHVVSSLSAAPSKNSWAAISDCLASLYVHGCDPDWLLLHAPFENNLRLVTLPSYAWDVKDYWITYRERQHPDTQAVVSGPALRSAQPISTCAQYFVEQTTKNGKVHVTLGASLSNPALLELIEGHRMQDAGLCPGSVFCEAAFVAAKSALEHSGRKDVSVDGFSLHKAHLRRPLTASLVGAEGELCTTAIVESETLVLVSFKAVSKPGSPARSVDLGNCSVKVTKAPATDQLDQEVSRGLEGSDSFYIRARMHEVTRSCKSRLQAGILYSLFSRAVQYGSDNYRCIQEAFISDDFSEAVAEVKLAADPADLRCVVSSPYWGEALAHLAGFLVNCHPDRFNGAVQGATSFIMDSLERFEQTSGAIEEGRSYFTYARVLQRKADTAVCEVVVFDDKDKLVMRSWGMRFHEVPNSVLKGLLPKAHSGQSDAVLLPAPESRSGLLLGSPKPRVLDVQNGTTPDLQETEKVSETEGPGLLEGELEHQNPSPGPVNAPAGLLQIILESMAEETGLSDTNELTDDASLTDLGVDSIMAVEICARIKTKSGHQLSPSSILEHPTIGHLARMFGRGITQQQEVAQQEKAQEKEHHSACRVDNVAAESHETDDFQKTASSSSSGSSTPAATPPPESSSTGPVETAEPPPKARIMLLQQGRPRAGAPPSKARLYLVCDGTGSISNYIHLLKHQYPLPVYGIDSPFLRCPSRFTPEVGIPGAAKYMVEALLNFQPNAGLSDSEQGSPLFLGGFSGGALFCYEMCRQLADKGRRVDGLVILDMRSPLPPPSDPSPPSDEKVWDILFATAQDSLAGQIHGSNAETNTTKHLRTMFKCVLGYHPPRREAAGPVFNIPAVVIWCARGMIGKLEARRPDLIKKLVELGYPIESYPGYMEDPRLGAMAWSIPHKKTESDLGPGGWENFVGGGAGENLLCLAVDADHHEVLHPITAPSTSKLIDQGLTFLLGGKTRKE